MSVHSERETILVKAVTYLLSNILNIFDNYGDTMETLCDKSSKLQRTTKSGLNYDKLVTYD